MTMFVLLRFFLPLFIFSSCVSGPKRENDSLLSRLNGENYYAKTSLIGIPVSFQRRKAITRISGKLLLNLIPLPEPFKYQTLVLLKDQQEVLQTLTDSEGKFEFASPLSNGNYQIQLQSKRYRAVYPLKIDRYKIEQIEMIAEPLSN